MNLCIFSDKLHYKNLRVRAMDHDVIFSVCVLFDISHNVYGNKYIY